MRRGPSWAAWIEIRLNNGGYVESGVAVPRGPRGLKYLVVDVEDEASKSRSLVGRVD